VALETADLMAMKTASIAALSTDQVFAFTTQQIAALTTAQVVALTTSDFCAMSSNQLAAFTAAQAAYVKIASPIVLDLDGNGISTLNISAGVQFDLHATGQAVNTGWVAPSDGLLALDRNGNGAIDDGSELFGTSTRLASGATAANGYAALRELDSNGDGVISAADADFGKLTVWVDANSDGVSSNDELHSLASLNIAQVDLNASAGNGRNNGNWVGLTSSYTSTDGSSHGAADVWFVADNAAGSISSGAGSMAQAMAEFSSAQAATTGSSAGKLALDGGNGQSGSSSALAASEMAATLDQFDANGKQVGGLGMAAAPADDLSLKALKPQASFGLLAISKA
jgi:hypothetical protein